MRSCEACGSRMSPFQPRSRNAAGLLVCKGCRQREGARTAGASISCWKCGGEGDVANGVVCPVCEGTGLVEASPMPWMSASRRVASYSDDERAVAQAFLDWFDGKIAHQDFGRLLDSLTEAGAMTDTIRRLDQCGPYGWEGSKQDGVALAESIVGKTASRRVVAHDSGDGETIYHCPFCGAGQVVGRSDGTAECGFCQTAFTVQVQPNMSAVPQTIDGVPHIHPDMPGADPGTVPTDEVPVETETALTPQEQADNNAVFAKRYFLTAEAVALDEEAYIRHLAIKHADDRLRAVAAVRAARR